MIIRIGTEPEHTTWRVRIARMLRLWASKLDGSTVVILATDDARLRTLCIRGCAQMFVQKQAYDYMQENAEDLARMEMNEALREWEPERREMQ